jgi:hypothetical protein
VKPVMAGVVLSSVATLQQTRNCAKYGCHDPTAEHNRPATAEFPSFMYE